MGPVIVPVLTVLAGVAVRAIAYCPGLEFLYRHVSRVSFQSPAGW